MQLKLEEKSGVRKRQEEKKKNSVRKEKTQSLFKTTFCRPASIFLP